MTDKILLPDKFDTKAIAHLKTVLEPLRKKTVDLDASAVAWTSTMALQFVASVCRQWREDDAEFRVSGPSEAFLDSCGLLGIPPATLGVEVTQESKA